MGETESDRGATMRDRPANGRPGTATAGRRAPAALTRRAQRAQARAPGAPRPGTAAADLERMRLRVRSRRIDEIVHALRARALALLNERGSVPDALRMTIRGFEHELELLHRRLASLPGEPT